MRKYITLLTNSIRKKLILYFTVIIAVFIAASGYTYFSGKILNDLYSSSLEKHLMLNNLFMNLSVTNDYLEKYLKSGSPEMYEKYNKMYPMLLESAQNLENTVGEAGSRRTVIDFKYMIQSYTEEANSSIVYYKEGNLSKSNTHYFGARDIYKLINGSFKNVFSVLLQDTNTIKVKIIDNRKSLYTLNGFLIVFIGIFCIIFLQRFSASITRPIRKLTMAASKVSKGDTDIEEVPITTEDEISILTMAFNKMVKRINAQIFELKEKVNLERKLQDEEMENLKIKNLLKESELKALQSRINPHFLFNSLNMISQTAFIEEASQTTSLLEAMSDLLRYNLDKFSKVVTIEDEISNVRDYVFIQQKRFGDRIRFHIECEESVMKSMLPCLIIQPLVENSIIHGVGFYTQDGEVGVDIKQDRDRVNLRIYDNGVGIEKEKLRVLEDMIASDDAAGMSEGIGLHNVCARLRIFFNNDVNITLRSEPGESTEIVLNLPYKVQGGIEECIA